jgi:CubicO group peptidase (beta-lactamase class C family)
VTRGGFSKSRLARMHDILAAHIDRGEFTGVLTMLCRHDAIHVDTIGYQDRERRVPIRRDTIFRIASMTKPITAAAAMLLVEECKLELDAPIDTLIPELANRRVLRHVEGAIDDTEPAKRALTLRDLLTFRMGFGFLMAPPDHFPIQQAETALQLRSIKPCPPLTHNEWIRRFSTLPLMYQPGERWLYHTGSEVLGVLIARVSGQPLEVFLRERLFKPLGMKDTAFHVPAEKLDRLACLYEVNPQTNALELDDDARQSKWASPPPFPSGGGGLVSTADDYLEFGRMLLRLGRSRRGRVLARPTVELMVSDHLTAEQKALSGFFPGFWDGHGWGFGVSPITRRERIAMVPGQFGWGGHFGTQWCSDPSEDLVAIIMTQRSGFGPLGLDFFTLVYQAIDD